MSSVRDSRPDLRSLDLGEMEALVASLGEQPFRARQLFRWVHRHGAAAIEAMTDLSAGLRRALDQQAWLTTLEQDAVQESSDGTLKYRFRTRDGQFLETVFMPERKRRTLCVSTQVGCAMGCTFCRTATMGLVRHLTTGEIVDQVYRVEADLRSRGFGVEPVDAEGEKRTIRPEGQRRLSNLVFMGMGEPLHNLDSVIPALRLLQHPEGLQFSHRHITVSTSGLVPEIERFGEETNVKLAVSLNATTDAQRERIMPVNRKYPIAELLEACRRFPMKVGRRITFEYVLLSGFNDAEDDASRLAGLLRGMAAKVNLIAYNQNPGLGFDSSPPERVEAFRASLERRGVTAVVRKNRGRDIAAACGQLAVAGMKRSRAKALTVLASAVPS
jgi:23S rRNA (adenine2503-C2)-methyltransferase